LASLDPARCGADFLFEVGRKKGNFLFPFPFLLSQLIFWPRPSVLKGKPAGRSLPKGQVGTNVVSEDP